MSCAGRAVHDLTHFWPSRIVGRGMGSAARRVIFVVFAAFAVAVVSSASGAASSASISVNVVLVKSPGAEPTVVPNGQSITVTGPAFLAGMGIGNVGPGSATVHVRLELPPGLHWGSDLPDPAESCTSTAATGDCTPVVDLSGSNLAVGWAWDIVADAPGAYPLKASVISSTTSDPDTSDNAATVTVIVEAKAPKVTAGAARVSPAKPRAGSTVVARVGVTADANAVRASNAACTATVGARRVAAKVRAALGVVTCTVRTPRSARGKTLRGTIAFSVQGTRLARRFSARLR
jgi:hypothetical protein